MISCGVNTKEIGFQASWYIYIYIGSISIDSGAFDRLANSLKIFFDGGDCNSEFSYMIDTNFFCKFRNLILFENIIL